MYDKSQIQNEEWNDASGLLDIGGKLGNSDQEKELRTCKCGEVSYSIRALSFHKNKCELVLKEKAEQLKKDLEDGTFIKCALCEEVGSSLALHVKKVHKMDKKEYVAKYGPVLSQGSRNKYSDVNKVNSNWIARAKENGEDLSEYWEKVSKGVKKAIMDSPEERERRSKNLGALNKTELFRKKASETAKKTSARKDVQQARAANLKRWRDNNKTVFVKNSLKLVCSCKKTKPEICLDKWLISNYFGKFRYSQFFYSKTFKTISNKKQLDFLSDDKNIAIEVDGPLHFVQTSLCDLQKIKEKDHALSQYCLINGKTLIRISYDSWAQSTGNFSNYSLSKIKEILDNPTPGVHFVGKSWNGEQYTFANDYETISRIYGV